MNVLVQSVEDRPFKVLDQPQIESLPEASVNRMLRSVIDFMLGYVVAAVKFPWQRTTQSSELEHTCLGVLTVNRNEAITPLKSGNGHHALE